jgi:hypothetical protein
LKTLKYQNAISKKESIVDASGKGTAAKLTSWTQDCTKICDGDAQCFAVTVGIRQRCDASNTDGDCPDSEYFCQMSQSVASQAVTSDARVRYEACQDYCGATSGSEMTCAQCQAANMTCFAKTTSQSQTYIRRGAGLCLTEEGKIPTMASRESWDSPWSPSNCKDKCTADSNCKGGMYARNVNEQVSYCKLFSDAVTQSSIYVLGIQGLTIGGTVDGCSSCKNCGDGTTCTAKTEACATEVGDPDSFSPYTDTDGSALCSVTVDNIDAGCQSCLDAYQSECFAKASVSGGV